MTAVVVTQAAKGKLRPEAATKAARFGGQTRYLWNLFLAASIKRYRAEKKFVFYSEMSARLPKQGRDIVNFGRSDAGGPGLSTALDCREQHRLFGTASLSRSRRTTPKIARLATDIAFIGLDDARERQFFATCEQGADAVSEKPSGLLSDAKMLRQLDAADALGAREDQIHGEIPSPERQVAVFHRRANCDAKVFPARSASVDARPFGDRRCVIDGAAAVTDRAMRPPSALQMRAAGFIGATPGEESGKLHVYAYVAECVMSIRTAAK